MKGKAAGPRDDCIGEIRFETPLEAQQALSLDGSELGGRTLRVEIDERSKDGTKLVVRGMSEDLRWTALKDHFKTVGKVLYGDVKTGCNLPCVGTVRFETHEQAAQALQLNGSDVQGYNIELKAHPGSKDRTKLQIFNLPPGLEWQELKDFFGQAGLAPQYVDTTCGKSSAVAEVRFEEQQDAQSAVNSLNGSSLGGSLIQVEHDADSRDGCKLRVSRIPPGTEWQELKDHFSQVGKIAYVNIPDPKKPWGNSMKGMGKGMLGPGLTISPSGLVVRAGGGGCYGGGYGKGFGKGGWGNGWKGGGKGGRKGGMGGGGGTAGEVRFDFDMHAQAAQQALDGSQLKGATISVQHDQSSQDGTKLVVTGLSPGTTWQELKDHFSRAGQVAFVNVR